MSAVGSPARPPVIVPASPAGANRWLRWVVLAGLAGIAVLLWRYQPAGQVFYPRCWTYSMTGLKCPGCGVLRATHAMLRGEFGLAWVLNPLWVCIAPLVAWTTLAWVAGMFGLKLPNPLARPWVLGAVGGLAVAYGIVRNIPGIPWPQ
jgi:hypothetical protein